MSKNKLFFLFAFILCLSVFCFSQNPQLASVVHTAHKINSQILNEERTILVRVPPNYQAGEMFPVVYMLDAHAPQNAMMAGIIEQQVWGGMMPEMIVVGIQNTNRTRDMTPTKTEREGSGGGENFLKFIEQEVIPTVEKNYRTQPFRIFAGHSLAGLAVVNSFVSRPDLFNAYIAASPVLHWDKNFVIKLSEELFKQNREFNKTLFITVGDEPDYINGFNSFQDLLKKSKPKNLEFEFRQFKDENHGSVVLPAYYYGLRKVFDGWQPPQTGAIADLENHYKKLSKRFGYEILVPEDLLNRAGYQLLNAEKFTEAIEIFKKNAANYPNSSNVYDSLGEAFEKNGQLKQARENYERAYNLAKAQSDEQRAEIFKKNLDRVSEKLK